MTITSTTTCTTTSTKEPAKTDERIWENQKRLLACASAHTSADSFPYHGLTRSNSFALLEATTWKQKILYTTIGLAVGVLICLFSLVFPLLLFPAASRPTYLSADYEYDAATSHFDNTAWTYGTDYLIAIAMLWQIVQFPTTCAQNAVHNWRSKALLASYACSVTFGGLCHQYYTTLEARNTWHSRFLWTLCVGSVTAGLAFMGAIATEMVRQDEALGLAFVPALPGWFWLGAGTTATAATAMGIFSFQRPACDIFVAGVAQSPSTFYLMALLARGLPTYAATLNRTTRLVGLGAFIMMSATLPSYPLAVQYTSWSLGTVNALLHLWLCIAWSTQGWTLRQISHALQQGPPAMVPVKRGVRNDKCA